MELLSKIQEVDWHAIFYPWVDVDRRSREPAIDNPKVIPTLLSNMKICIPDANLSTQRAGLPKDLLWIHGTSRQDNGEHWVVAEIDGTRDVEDPAPASRRNNETQLAIILSQ